MIWRILLLGLLGALAEGANVAGPSDFYIVTDGSYQQKRNQGAASYQELLTVAADGRDSVIRYIRLEQVAQIACGQGLIVKGMEARLLDVSPAELAGEANPCAADRRALGLAQKRRGEGNSAFEQEMGIVARCGPRQSSLRLIDPRIVWAVPAAGFSAASRDLWELGSRVIDRAFPNRTPWNGGSAADDFAMQEVGARMIPELAKGKYDQGLRQACNPRFGSCQTRTFRELLNDYQGPRDTAELATMTAPRLLDADRYAFAKYADPVYPALAKSARIQGQVELELVVDPPTGDVLSVSVESGHPMFKASATEAAKQWRFAPGWANSTGVKLVLEYAIHCPGTPPLKPIPAGF
ncbi:MAG TPA: energy transducer TonB [Bryobacteraceae bacterium]|nr:energy transducer TonB [Bryobacteraceae bacterium]